MQKFSKKAFLLLRYPNVLVGSTQSEHAEAMTEAHQQVVIIGAGIVR
ncbi:MAG: hypothetical protein ACI9HA_003142, partial [Dinoroseobacter sp.]